jgi:hypothetical protein
VTISIGFVVAWELNNKNNIIVKKTKTKIIEIKKIRFNKDSSYTSNTFEKNV